MSARGNLASRRAAALLAGALLLAPGLLSAQSSRYSGDGPRRGHLIGTVPYERVLQRNYCGPACLAMVLNSWDGARPVSQQAIADQVYDPRIEGAYGSDLVWSPLERGFQSYSFRGNLPLLKDLVRRDIPVIVLTKSSGNKAKGHYLVVVGFDDEKGLIIFHDPYFGERRVMTVREFTKDWGLGKGADQSRWMMAAVPQGRPFPLPYLLNDPMTALNLAVAYLRRGDFEKSRREWEKVRRSLGADPCPAYGLAIISLKEGKFEEAESHALEAIGLDSKNVEARDALGLAYAAQGKLAEALDALGQAVRLAPREPAIRDHYLRVLERARADAPPGRRNSDENR